MPSQTIKIALTFNRLATPFPCLERSMIGQSYL